MSNTSFCCDCPTWCGSLQCCGLDVPEFLKIPQDERNAAWANMPPPPPPRVLEIAHTEDPSTIALRAELEATKKAKSGKRIEKLLAARAPPVDHSGERWDAHKARWVPLRPLGKITHPEPPQGPEKPIKTKGKSKVAVRPKGKPKGK